MEVRARALPRAAEALLLRPQDIALTLASTAGVAVLAFARTRPEGWEHATSMLALAAILPVLCRTVEQHWSTTATRALATFLPPILGILLIYSNLDPVLDVLNPHLDDARLASTDLQLFGVHPGMWLEQHLPRPAMDALFVCYTSYYVWPVSIGVILFVQGQPREAELQRFILGYVLLMLATYVGYILVPAVGPRFYLAAGYDGPVHAGALGQWLDATYRRAPFFRDCFPSGHTALTLYCLHQARTLTPRWFRVMLVPGIGLITATLACRFHYGLDVLCGPLVALAAVAAANALQPRAARIAQRRGQLVPAHGRAR